MICTDSNRVTVWYVEEGGANNNELNRKDRDVESVGVYNLGVPVRYINFKTTVRGYDINIDIKSMLKL